MDLIKKKIKSVLVAVFEFDCENGSSLQSYVAPPRAGWVLDPKPRLACSPCLLPGLADTVGGQRLF